MADASTTPTGNPSVSAPAVPRQRAGERTDLPLRQSTEIQGDVLAGFRKDHVHLLMLAFTDRRRARRWLERLRRRIATTREVAAFNEAYSRARALSGDDPAGLSALWRGVSFTHSGLVALLGHGPIADLPRGSTQEAFAQGPAHRAELLGDTGPSSPGHWLFGAEHDTVHAVLTVAADRPGELREALAREREEIAAHRLLIVFEQDGGTLEGPRRGKEHFGFKDGISQPAVEGFDEPDPERPEHQRGKPGTRIIAAGEFVVGHPKDHRLPGWLPEWMTDGSFQVVRRLAQDVPGWWAQVAGQLEVLREQDAVPEDATVEWLAARLVGRWRSGTPVAVCPHADRPADPAVPENDISYADDSEGRTTPLFSHLRKTNPRDGLRIRPEDPEPLAERGALDGRRLMRRGIPYGMPFDPAGEPGSGPDAPRGLLFVCYQSDLVAQFEFVQRSWVELEDFPPREAPPGRDAVIGRDTAVSFPAGGADSTRTVPLDFRRFVRTEGALYAFAPSLSALARLAAGTVPEGGGPLEDRVLEAPAVLRRFEVVSAGKARLRLQADGDLTVHDENEELRWHSGTAGLPVSVAEFRTGGDFVLWDNTGERILWTSATEGNPGALLAVRTDGDVMISAADGRPLWRTGTAH